MTKTRLSKYSIGQIDAYLYYVDIEQWQLLRSNQAKWNFLTPLLVPVTATLLGNMAKQLNESFIVSNLLVRVALVGLVSLLMKRLAVWISDTIKRRSSFEIFQPNQEELQALYKRAKTQQATVQVVRFILLAALIILALVFTFYAETSMFFIFTFNIFVFEGLTYEHPAKVKKEILQWLEKKLNQDN